MIKKMLTMDVGRPTLDQDEMVDAGRAETGRISFEAVAGYLGRLADVLRPNTGPLVDDDYQDQLDTLSDSLVVGRDFRTPAQIEREERFAHDEEFADSGVWHTD
ncbi:MAG: hypothetical protein ACRD4B_05445 [Acidobacteriota bacterium]